MRVYTLFCGLAGIFRVCYIKNVVTKRKFLNFCRYKSYTVIVATKER